MKTTPFLLFLICLLPFSSPILGDNSPTRVKKIFVKISDLIALKLENRALRKAIKLKLKKSEVGPHYISNEIMKVNTILTLSNDSGGIGWTVPIANGKANGTIKFYKNNQLMMKLTASKGILHGMVRIYHPDGILEESHQFSDGYPHGRSKLYGKKGQLLNVTSYSMGTTNGEFFSYLENGYYKTIGQYEDGIKSGKWIYYYTGTEPELWIHHLVRNGRSWKDAKETVGLHQESLKLKNQIARLEGKKTDPKTLKDVMKLSGNPFDTWSKKEWENGAGINYVEWYENNLLMKKDDYANGQLITRDIYDEGVRVKRITYESGKVKHVEEY